MILVTIRQELQSAITKLIILDLDRKYFTSTKLIFCIVVHLNPFQEIYQFYTIEDLKFDLITNHCFKSSITDCA